MPIQNNQMNLLRFAAIRIGRHWSNISPRPPILKEVGAMCRILNLSFFAALFAVGCASKAAFLKHDFATEPVAIRVNAAALSVADQRKNITGRKLKIPFISQPNQHDRIEPQLPDSPIQLVKSEVKKYFVGGTKDVIVNVNILQGSQAFAASLLNEKETVEMEKLSKAMPFPPDSKIRQVYAFIACFQPNLVVGLQRDGEWYLPGGILEGKKDSTGISGAFPPVFNELAPYVKQQTGLALTGLSEGLQIMMRQVDDGAELTVLYAGRATGKLSRGVQLAVKALPKFAPVCGEPEKLIREFVKEEMK